MTDISFSNEFGSMSASSCSQEMCVYSAPTSPSKLKLRVPSGFQTGSATPRTYEDANSNLDEFEFETSHRFNVSDLGIETNHKDVNLFDHQQEQQQRLCGDSMPTMAFADELFCDGKVMPLIPPLKLPPKLLLQNGDSNKTSTQSSPRSPGSVLKLPFSRLWNDDFDPFRVALEKVREEKRGKPKAKHGLRRTRSLSPFRGYSDKSDKHVDLSQSLKAESHCCDTAQLICGLQKEPEGTNILYEPKGLVFARQVRLVGVSNDAIFEPKKTSVSKLDMETKKDESQRGGFWTRNKKRESIKKFLFGNGNMKKANAQHKLEDKKPAQGKPALLRKHDMKSETLKQSTQLNTNETAGELTKMRSVCRRLAKTFSLLGSYGREYKVIKSHPF